MNDEDLLKVFAEYFETWASKEKGKAYPAFDLEHAYEIMSNAPGAPRLAVMCQGEAMRVPFPGGEIIGRTDRTFYLLVGRGRGLQKDRGASLVTGTGGGKPTLQMVRELREMIQSYTPDVGVECPLYYKGYSAWGADLGFPADTYRIEFEVGVQLEDQLTPT